GDRGWRGGEGRPLRLGASRGAVLRGGALRIGSRRPRDHPEDDDWEQDEPERGDAADAERGCPPRLRTELWGRDLHGRTGFAPARGVPPYPRKNSYVSWSPSSRLCSGRQPSSSTARLGSTTARWSSPGRAGWKLGSKLVPAIRWQSSSSSTTE